VLNLKLDQDVKAMRAIAEEAFEMVREYKGSHSGEHGDGIVRSEFHEPMFGARSSAFEEVKDRFDPHGLLNPARSCAAEDGRPQRCSATRRTTRAGSGDRASTGRPGPGAGGGFQGAVEMCNNNGACRKLEAA
jgi:hypothetical protein